MSYEWVEAYCLQMPGVETDFQEDWQARRYLVGGKMFAMEGENKEGRSILTFKQEPARGDFLRQTYPGVVVPGYYMNKVHWNTFYKESGLTDDLVRDFLNRAYAAIVATLPKKTRDALPCRKP